MTWRRLICFIGRHDLTVWRKVKDAPRTIVPFPELPGSDYVAWRNGKPFSERHCKRAGCKFSEWRPLKRRASNPADTIQRAS